MLEKTLGMRAVPKNRIFGSAAKDQEIARMNGRQRLTGPRSDIQLPGFDAAIK
jgi:hypothetical protein